MAQMFVGKSGEMRVGFLSIAPIENIEANGQPGPVFLKMPTLDFQMAMTILNFRFKNALMEEHFNENYMESERFPKAIFKGKLSGDFDPERDGSATVTASGELEIHGVKKQVSVNGSWKRTNNTIKLEATFPVKPADYGIRVPSMYLNNIATSVDVSFSAVLELDARR